MNKLCDLKEVFKKIYQFENELKTKYDLSINMALCLCTLSENKYCSGDLANELGISTTRISRVLGSLEKRNLVRREVDTEDKRVMFFMLTQTGIEKVSKMKCDNIEIPEFVVKNV